MDSSRNYMRLCTQQTMHLGLMALWEGRRFAIPARSWLQGDGLQLWHANSRVEVLGSAPPLSNTGPEALCFERYVEVCGGGFRVSDYGTSMFSLGPLPWGLPAGLMVQTTSIVQLAETVTCTLRPGTRRLGALRSLSLLCSFGPECRVWGRGGVLTSKQI